MDTGSLYIQHIIVARIITRNDYGVTKLVATERVRAKFLLSVFHAVLQWHCFLAPSVIYFFVLWIVQHISFPEFNGGFILYVNKCLQNSTF